MHDRLLVALALAGLALLGFFSFPGHTFLFSDTLIYVPILEHLRNPGVLARDMVAVHPHVSFTVYDEVTIGLTPLAGSLRNALAVQQLAFRWVGLLGVYLIAAALGLSRRMAILAAATFALGATILGPTVLTFEYEPIPRGFAAPCILAAIGLACSGRHLAAGIAGSVAFLYHPPTVFTYWAVSFALTLWPARADTMARRIRSLGPLIAASLLLFVLSRHQQGIAEPQTLFGLLDAAQEKLQRFRSPYLYVSIWLPLYYPHYLVTAAIWLGAFLRLRKSMSQEASFFAFGMPALGLLSVPASYLLLEKWKLAFVPQFQPTRALLFLTVFAALLAAVAGLKAASSGRALEALLWLLAVYAIPLSPMVTDLVWPARGKSLDFGRLAVQALLAALAWAAARFQSRRWAAVPWAAAVLVPFFVIPGWARVVNYVLPDSPELVRLCAWARASTPPDSVFLFPDAGRSIEPGFFRATAQRAVYVEWKAGGQANFMKAFGEEWWRRWSDVMARKYSPALVPHYRELGIDFLVVPPARTVPGREPVFANARFKVYRIAAGDKNPASSAYMVHHSKYALDDPVSCSCSIVCLWPSGSGRLHQGAGQSSASRRFCERKVPGPGRPVLRPGEVRLASGRVRSLLQRSSL